MPDDAPYARLTVAELAQRDDFALGSAWISPSTRVAHGPGGKASLEPRAMQVLLALAEAAGSVVTRDALFRRCWGNAVVGDDSLNRAIGEVRRVARTVAADSFSIETVPRTGYRLVETPTAAPPPIAPPPLWQPAAPSAWGRRAFIAAGAAVTAAGAFWALARSRASAEVQGLIDQSDQAMRTGLPSGSEQAARLLHRAVAIEPRNAAAWGRLALAHVSRIDTLPPDEVAATVAAAQEAARRARALEPRQPDALGALAILPPYFGAWLPAERRMRGVLESAPDHLPTMDELAFLLVAVGRAAESSRWRLDFAAREPLHAGHQYRLAYAHWILGRVADADRTADRALQLWPKHVAVWLARLTVLAFTGRPARALALLEDAAARPDLPPRMVATIAAALTAMESRRPADVAGAVDRLVADVTRGPTNAINAILYLSALGAIDRAFDVADAYLLEKGPLMASVRWRAGQVSINDQRRRKTNMLFVPASAPMRADPRFAGLVEQIGLADYWAAAGARPDYLQS